MTHFSSTGGINTGSNTCADTIGQDSPQLQPAPPQSDLDTTAHPACPNRNDPVPPPTLSSPFLPLCPQVSADIALSLAAVN